MLWWTIHKLKSSHWHERADAAKKLGESSNRFAVGPLIIALKDENEFVKSNAARALHMLGKLAVKPLIISFKNESNESDKFWDFRGTVVEVLGNIGDERAIELLISISITNEIVANALERIGKPAVKPIISLLHNKNYGLQREATKILGNIGDDEAIAPLISHLKSDDIGVVQTAMALVKIDPNWVKSESAKSTVPNLINALSGEHGSNAEKVLEKINSNWMKTEEAKKAVPGLIQALSHGYRSNVLEKIDPNWTKSEAANNLIPSLIFGLFSIIVYSEKKRPAEYVLETINPNWPRSEAAKNTVPDIIVALKENPDITYQESVLEVLGAIGDIRVTEPLMDMLQEQDKPSSMVETLLFSILDKSVKQIDSDILIRITKLKNTILFYHHRSCSELSSYSSSSFSEVKQLARQELIHRGLEE